MRENYNGHPWHPRGHSPCPLSSHVKRFPGLQVSTPRRNTPGQFDLARIAAPLPIFHGSITNLLIVSETLRTQIELVSVVNHVEMIQLSIASPPPRLHLHLVATAASILGQGKIL